MASRLRASAIVMAALAALLVPGPASAIVQHDDGQDAAQDFDSRAGRVAPTAAQRATVARLGAAVTWNRFGTPASLTRHGRYLASGIQASNAAAAARQWLEANKALFRLPSTEGLALDSDTRMAGSKGHAVNFRQVFGGLVAQEGGLATIGLTGSKTQGWKVAYVSSSITSDRRLAIGARRLRAPQAWVRAARSVGRDVSVRDVRATKRALGWQNLIVTGAKDIQRAKLVAFPTPRQGVLPAWETLVVDKSEPSAFRIFVDARDGKVLARFGLVHNLAEFLAAPVTETFSGTLGPDDASCGPDHTFAVGDGVRALDGFADADVPTNDVVLFLLKDGEVLVEADTLFTPESFHYEPEGGVEPGNYVVRVCDFEDGSGWTEPRTYQGTFTIDDSPAPPPYLARWKAFPANPPLATLPADPWNNPSTDTREVWCWRQGNPGDCDRIVGNLASRGPWDHDHKANSPTFTTEGNNARSATSWEDPFLPSPPQYQPTSSGRDYSFEWTNAWSEDDCDPTPGAPGATWDDSAATVNLFVMHNRMHDWSYFLGFTEENWNAQDYNFGLTEPFRENDPIVGDVQAGANVGARDNANMITLPDGQASVTNMYFWQPLQAAFYSPCVDGDYDMAVIGHEYTHMIENRMIGKGSGRSGHHAGAMGESEADFTAMEYLNENGFVPTSDENRYAVGAYATGNKQRAIRNYGMNFPSSGGVPQPGQQLNINALNFSDMGYDAFAAQPVHADGEIWSATNFDIRRALIDKYNGAYPESDADLQQSCADGELPAQNCPGNRRWIQLVFDSYLLMPTNPSMLQARDAVLSADLMRFGGANQKELWLAYARRGFGVNAASSNANASTDTDPTPDFEPVGTSPATVRFRARNSDRDSISARIYVGHYEARVSPIADTNPATTGTNLDDVAKFAPGTYELVANAPGYGHVRFRQTFRSGRSERVTIEFPTNWASMTSGATATGDGGAEATNLIDDTEGTNWTAEGNITASGDLSVDGKQVTVDLAGTSSRRIRYVQVSALLGAQNRFTALRQFEIWACNATIGADCAGGAGFTKIYTSPANAFPGDAPRPVLPHMLLRLFDVPDTNATHLRLVAKTTQCTGGPDFQGEQDADPATHTDCDSAVPSNASWRFVRAAELQAFSSSPSVSGGGGGGGGDD
jgi:extracellular elastinolytic metalloproteinase